MCALPPVPALPLRTQPAGGTACQQARPGPRLVGLGVDGGAGGGDPLLPQAPASHLGHAPGQPQYPLLGGERSGWASSWGCIWLAWSLWAILPQEGLPDPGRWGEGGQAAKWTCGWWAGYFLGSHFPQPPSTLRALDRCLLPPQVPVSSAKKWE